MADSNNRVWAASTPGKRHSPADVRRQTFQYAGGASGLIAAAGGGVGLTPGTPMSVRLDPCSVVVRSGYSGRSDEAYSFTVKSPQDVTIRTTGSGGGRTDVVGFVVSDPVLEGKKIAETDAQGNVVDGSDGLDPNEYDYWKPHVFENVPSSAARDTAAFRAWVVDNNLVEGMAVPYAKVVQAADSVGLEGKVTPFFDTILGQTKIIPPIVTSIASEKVMGPTDTYLTLGPSIPIEIPSWARYVSFSIQATGVFVRHSEQTSARGSSGYLRARFVDQNTHVTRWDMDINQGRISRGTYTVARRFAIPAELRGTVQNAQLFGTNDVSLTAFGVNSGTTLITNATFEEGS